MASRSRTFEQQGTAPRPGRRVGLVSLAVAALIGGIVAIAAPTASAAALPRSTHSVTLSAGGRHACVIVTGGIVRCWGSDDSGQLGPAASGDSSTPISVTGISGAQSLAAR